MRLPALRCMDAVAVAVAKLAAGPNWEPVRDRFSPACEHANITVRCVLGARAFQERVPVLLH